MQAAASAAVLAPTVAAPRLLAELGAGTVMVGVYVAIVYFAAMASSQWGATLVRRWGPIRTSQAALLCCAVGLLLVAMAQPMPALIGALLLGVGYGPITPASSEMLARSTSRERYALVFSVKQTGVPLGGALAGLMVPLTLEAIGARWALAQVAALCMAGIVLAALLRGRLDAWRDPHSPLPSMAQTLQPVRMVLRHPVLRRLALCTLVFSAVQVSLTAYAVTFLHGELDWGLVAAGGALTAAQVAGVVGRIGWGWVADRWNAARYTLLGLSAAMALCSVTMALLKPDTAAAGVVVVLAIYGATAIGWNGVFLATVARWTPHDQTAMATAGSLFFTYLGVVIGPPLFGAVGALTGSLGMAFALLAAPLAWTLWALRRPAAKQSS